MNFIPGRTVQQTDFENCDLLARFAKCLRKLHQSEESFPVACSPFQRFHHFFQKGERERITYPSQFAEVKALMEKLEATFQLHPIPHVPTHLDLHPLNIMYTGECFFLVDWVNGGLSDPFFDLATFTFFLSLSESQTLAFLTHYFERSPTEFEWNRLIVVKPIRLFVIAAALLSTSSDESRSVSYEEALISWKLPSIADIGKNERGEPLWLFGLTMLKAGLELVGQDHYQIASGK